MGKALSPKEMRLYRLCDEALYYLWDPIGVSGSPEARDEYQGYLPRVFAFVTGNQRDELVAYLCDLSEHRMGFARLEDAARSAADFMFRCREWVERTGE